MTTREFRALSFLSSMGCLFEINEIQITLYSQNREAVMEIPITPVEKFDLYSVLKRGIRENLYQVEDSRSKEVQEFKENIEHLL